MNNELYKCYQLMEYFVSKYDYNAFFVRGLRKENEIWIINKENSNYQLIRISNDFSVNEENAKRISIYIGAVKQRLRLKNPKFLDIRVSNDIAIQNEKIDTVCLNSDYYNGVDLKNVYFDLDKVVHDVDNQEEEIRRLVEIINLKFSSKPKPKKSGFFLKSLFNKECLVSKIIILISIVLYILTYLLCSKYSSSAALIFMGANYKMFTLGLNEYWRLITGAFLHSSFIHIFCNCVSLYTISLVLEPQLGKFKYSLLFICGIIGASLTHGVLSGNSLVTGLSGGIYALFAYLIMYFVKSNYLSMASLMPTILINLMLNFLPNVSWQSHLGGALIGILFYYIYEDDKINWMQFPIILILFAGLFYKFYDDHLIRPFYGLTDMEVVQIASDFNLDNYAEKTAQKLYKIYLTEGAQKW